MTVYKLRITCEIDTEGIIDATDIINLALEDHGIKVTNIQVNGNDESLSQSPIKKQPKCKICGKEINIDPNMQESYTRKPDDTYLCNDCYNKDKVKGK